MYLNAAAARDVGILIFAKLPRKYEISFYSEYHNLIGFTCLPAVLMIQ